MRSLRWLTIAVAVLACASPARADSVTEWSRLADALGHGGANWRTMAIMYGAMHDAWNAASPTYARWYPASAGEPSGAGAQPEVAMAAAGRRVLAWLHPDDDAQADRLLLAAYRRIGDSPAARAALVLGDAIADAAIARRKDDGFFQRRPFSTSSRFGKWRPVPQEFGNVGTTSTQPFLFPAGGGPVMIPPPAPDTEAFQREMTEVLQLGSLASDHRTPAQSAAAYFWAYQSSQRGMVALGAALLNLHPRPGGLVEHLRIMSQLATAMADSAILSWVEKEQFGRWRPITAIRDRVPGNENWFPLIDTPGHPEYPSGHAADCFVGALVLSSALPGLPGPIVYTVQTGRSDRDAVGMGQHAQGAGDGEVAARRFDTLLDAAQQCADSRIWAGAHFRSANNEARHLAESIARRALASVPPLR